VALSDARREFGVALMADGSLLGLGDDSYGQASPPAGRDFTAVAVGRGERAAHGLALRRDGSVAAWGDDSFGQTRAPADLTGATAVAAGEFWSAARLADGGVRRWGKADEGALEFQSATEGREVVAKPLD
jgi:alpha-tubulin suppressor-like RCC1 family protein